ncbi:magnesium chelatase subunit D [Palleronia sp. LCG004]|uniref:magnesium chelatase subunit D n=1 Tax=Palleronia sp. LCG004 TaxID=3079304 RepID=UPI002942AFA3|nr:magnesium chelatase subunit D [Palleronia sp. LCG004]WOI56333.1 magnesium chelatase subunit D [Palleronia sp. LCG004]
MSGSPGWARVRDALRLFALDPKAMGGIWIRSRPGPARDRVLDLLAPLGARRITPNIADETLDGGMDLAATLALGRPVERDGILARGDLICLGMAERTAPGLAARLGQAIDRRETALLVLDEAAGEDETLAAPLVDRLSLFLDLSDLRLADLGQVELRNLDAARARRARVMLTDDDRQTLVATAMSLGIRSLRAPMLAAQAARGLAALAGRDRVEIDDLRRAVELTLAHRALAAEDAPPDQSDAPPDDDAVEPPEPPQDDAMQGTPPQDMLVDAARAELPADLLRALAAGRAARVQSAARGSGAAIRSNRRGRPLPARQGRPSDAARLDLAATLRAAAPWQKVRGGAGPEQRLTLRLEDLHVRQFEQKSDRLLIFVVDASGSQAMSRLAEAKGAIEILLSQAYARRDHVALVAFRGTGAEILLPPTRSLVQTRKRLAALPGGGGTPLAAGLFTAANLARQVRGRGFTPSLALLTDGRANIALDGAADRQAAARDARLAAAQILALCPGGIVIDTGRRPTPDLAALADAMAAHYLPLPRADAARLGRAVAPIMAG